MGLLVLDGVLLRSVGVDGRFGAELLGAGDLLRPWQTETASLRVRQTVMWRALEPTRLALLDRSVAGHLTRYPELVTALMDRTLERARRLAINVAIVHQPRVEVRLQMLLWHLATRWSEDDPRGTLVPLSLSHTVLARLVAARRPTVTTALSQLAREGLVQARDHQWLLLGEPPEKLLEIGSPIDPQSCQSA